MEVKELRIGSTYNSTKFQKPVICTAEDIYEMVVRAEGAAVGGDEVDSIFQPLPLTEKWLFEHGFLSTKNGDNTFWRRGNLQLSRDDELQVFELILNRLTGVEGNEKYIFSPDHNGSNVWIEYTHQLENLYFALTGEELNETT